MAKKLKVKKRTGDLVDYPYNTIKKILATAGFTGKTLALAATGVFKEAGKLARAGIISAADLEKAIVKSVSNTNQIVIDSAKKITKKVLK